MKAKAQQCLVGISVSAILTSASARRLENSNNDTDGSKVWLNLMHDDRDFTYHQTEQSQQDDHH